MFNQILKATVPDNGGEYYSTKESSCNTCALRSKVVPTLCLAFPKGIPAPLLMGEVKHDVPYEGDKGIVYEPVQSIAKTD